MKEILRKKIDEVVANISRFSSESEIKNMDILMNEAFSLATTPEERKEAGAYLRKSIAGRKRNDVDSRALLGDTTNALSLSYIAKKYFGKDRTWLYQRLNGSLVNGKPAAFTQSELTVLANSFKDLSLKLSEISSNIIAAVN